MHIEAFRTSCSNDIGYANCSRLFLVLAQLSVNVFAAPHKPLYLECSVSTAAAGCYLCCHFGCIYELKGEKDYHKWCW